MREINKIAEGLFEKIRDRFEDVSLGDDKAKATQDPEKARFFNFDYVVDDHDHGNITISLIDETSLKVYFSKNISHDLDKEHKKEWYGFLRELRRFAKENLLSFEPRDITRSTLKHRDIQQVSKADSTYSKDEVVAESLYGTRKSSYERRGPVRLIVRHSKALDEVENRRARTHNINSIYLETQEGERFKLPVKSLRLGRALAQHVKHGGSMQDELGQHICEMAVECAKLKPFISNTRHRTFEDTQTQAMVEAAFEYHGLLNNTLKRMTGRKGYKKCAEQFVATSTSYIPEVDAEEMKERFVKRTYDDRLEEALPLVHKAYNMKKENKFAEQFVNWADTIAEGTWAIPEEEDDIRKLIDILSKPLPAGVDGQNAQNMLYNIIGDDKLFDQIYEISKVDSEEDVRSVVQNWLQENLPNIYQQIEAEMGDTDTPDQFNSDTEGGDVDEGTYGSGDSGVDGVVYESDEGTSEDSLIDLIYDILSEQPRLGDKSILKLCKQAIEEDGDVFDNNDIQRILALIPNIRADVREANRMYEEKDKITYDPKTGKLTGWEHEGDWKKTDKKDPVGKIHHMSDVARRRTEKMADKEVKEDHDSQDDDGGVEAIMSSIIRRIAHQHHDLLLKLGPDGVLEAAREQAEFSAPVDEIGSSDVSNWIRAIKERHGIEQEQPNELEEAYKKALDYCDACDHTKESCICEETITEDKITDFLQSFVGQTFYVPAEGQKGTVSSVADQTRFSMSLVVELANGTSTVVHFKDLKPVEETPGPVKQIWQRLVATVTGGATPKYQPKQYGSVPMDMKEDIVKLAGIKQ